MNIDGIKGHRIQIKNLELLIKRGHIPQTILFTGPSGIGKRIIAKRFLNSFFCKSKDPPCLSCTICNQIAQGIFPDFIEIVPNERGIIPIGSEEGRERGSIRGLIDRLSKKSIYGKIGVIIDCIDRMTEEGQNALLKTIEDPSSGVYIILVSSNKARLLDTILSRCTEIRFSFLSDDEIKDTLKSSGLDGNEADFIARISGGSIGISSILASGDIMKIILGICVKISSFLKNGGMLDIDLNVINKKISTDLLLDLIINIYRQNLLSIIKEDKHIYSQVQDIYIQDIHKIYNLLKNLLVLKKRESDSINIRNAIKGMLYSLHNQSDIIPYTDFSRIV